MPTTLTETAIPVNVQRYLQHSQASFSKQAIGENLDINKQAFIELK